MKRFDVRNIGAILLIIAGALLLLQNLGVFEVAVALIWSLLFAAGGLVLLYLFLTERTRHWWAIIPGFALVGVAALIVLDEFFPRIGGDLGGMIFLGGLGLAFWVIYFQKREYWWAIIPGGTLVTLALIVGLESVFEGDELGGILFLGLGLTFGLLYFQKRKYWWALIPAAVLLAMGLLITVAAMGAFEYLVALALILVGLYLLLRLFTSR